VVSVQAGCPTRYRTRHFFNNFTTNEDIETKFEAGLPQRNLKEKNVLLFKFSCNIFIGIRIIKEMAGCVASGTLCINIHVEMTVLLSSFLNFTLYGSDCSNS